MKVPGENVPQEGLNNRSYAPKRRRKHFLKNVPLWKGSCCLLNNIKAISFACCTIEL